MSPCICLWGKSPIRFGGKDPHTAEAFEWWNFENQIPRGILKTLLEGSCLRSKPFILLGNIHWGPFSSTWPLWIWLSLGDVFIFNTSPGRWMRPRFREVWVIGFRQLFPGNLWVRSRGAWNTQRQTADSRGCSDRRSWCFICGLSKIGELGYRTVLYFFFFFLSYRTTPLWVGFLNNSLMNISSDLHTEKGQHGGRKWDKPSCAVMSEKSISLGGFCPDGQFGPYFWGVEGSPVAWAFRTERWSQKNLDLSFPTPLHRVLLWCLCLRAVPRSVFSVSAEKAQKPRFCNF